MMILLYNWIKGSYKVMFIPRLFNIIEYSGYLSYYISVHIPCIQTHLCCNLFPFVKYALMLWKQISLNDWLSIELKSQQNFKDVLV